jgi:formate dehydrogenase subunit delta
MNSDKLIRMANQIASYFRSYPEEQAISGIHDHIVAFWTPRMRKTLSGAISQPDLDPLVVRAVLAHHTGPSPIEKEIAGPTEVGQLGSDAG